MKIKTSFLALCFGGCSLFAAHAQNTGRLTIDQTSVPLSSVISAIESQTDHTFFINDGTIDINRRVSLTVSGATLSETLNKVFDSTPYAWALSGKQIVLSVKATAATTPQTRKVTGRVTSADGEALIGAVVTQTGNTSNAVITNANGDYSINMAGGADELNISLLGYASQRVAVAGRGSVNVVMSVDARRIDDVVVVGYGTVHSREITSSITQISGSSLTAGIGGANIATALQGKIPGLVISQTASPNAGSTLQLRGIGSYNASQQPLVVIDGIPGGSLNAVDQNDIETITVLKDASAGAIYGTRAAAGVVLITTKKAKAGTITAKYTAELSTENARRIPDLLSHDEYLETGRGQDYGGRDDWYKAMMRDNALSQKHTVNIMGGSDKAAVYASMGYSDQYGISIGDGRKDYFGRLNSTFNLWDGIAEFRVNLNYRQIDRDYRNGESLGANSKNMYTMAMILNPTIPIYYDGDPTGYNQLRDGYVNANGEKISMGMDTDFWNHIANIATRTNRNLDNYLQADATLKINLTPKLSVQGTFGHQGFNRQITTYRTNKSRQAIEGGYNGYAYHSYERTSRVSTEAYANYNNSFGDHRVDATAGWSFLETNGESFNASNSDFPVDGSALWNFGGGAALNDLARRNGGVGMSSSKNIRNRLLGVFARANYSYDNRYMVTASVRRDANSTFGANNKWGTFWALSGGWRISNEAFMKNVTWVDDLKLRAGYGVVGNAPGAGQSRSYYSPDGTSQWIAPDGLWYVSYGPSRNQNPNLKWEESHSLNIGLDYSLLDNRLYGSFDIFQRNVKDMLYNQNVPMPPNVFTTTLVNIGTLRGTGWEFSIGGDVVRTKNLTYSTTLRASHDKTKLTDLGNVERIDLRGFPSPGSPGSAVRYTNGSTIGKFWVFKNAGLDENGRWLIELPETGEVVPYTGNSAVTNKHWVGNAIPKVVLSWDHNIRYKNLDFGLNLRSWIGHDVYNMQDMYFGVAAMSGSYNLLKSSQGKNKDIKQTGVLTDWFIEKGTFLKVDAIYLGYTLNTARWIKYLQNARFYLTARDVLVVTGYTGMNPEVTITGLTPGFDSDTVGYPQLARFTFGVELTF